MGSLADWYWTFLRAETKDFMANILVVYVLNGKIEPHMIAIEYLHDQA